MGVVENKEEMTGNEVTVNDSQMRGIAGRFSSRGLAETIKRDTEAQIAREEQIRANDPETYRLSSYSEEYIDARYRHGKGTMSGEDLIEYFREGHERHVSNTDFSAETPREDLVARGDADRPVLRTEKTLGIKEKLALAPAQARSLPSRTKEWIRLSAPGWFNGEKASTERDVYRFPISAFAAILAIAMSLILVVASSVMIYHSESELNSLKIELSALSEEIGEMKADLNTKTDLLAIRDIAVNEFGMVSEEFVRQEYIFDDDEDSIVIYEDEGEQMIGLSAILNALGIK